VNISRATHDFLGGRFKFAPRGELEAKGKGKLAMFFVDHLNSSQPNPKGHSWD
jgi:hypothetical protein